MSSTMPAARISTSTGTSGISTSAEETGQRPFFQIAAQLRHQTPGHVGISGGVAGRIFHRDQIHRRLLLPVPMSSLMGVISTSSRRQARFFSPRPRLPGSIRNSASWYRTAAGDTDAVAAQHGQIVFGIVCGLSAAPSSSTGFSAAITCSSGKLLLGAFGTMSDGM